MCPFLQLDHTAQWWVALLAQHDDGQPLGEAAKVSHLCCLCSASLAASSIRRLKGGVRRQMLNDSLKATTSALISSPVCACCHRNWPEHLKRWVTLQYILGQHIHDMSKGYDAYFSAVKVRPWKHFLAENRKATQERLLFDGMEIKISEWGHALLSQ